MKLRLQKLLPNNIKTKVAYPGKKLASNFNIKDKTKFEHQHDIIYLGDCPNKDCNDNYIGEVIRRIEERVIDQNGRDKSSHLYKHAIERDHQHVNLSNLNHL